MGERRDSAPFANSPDAFFDRRLVTIHISGRGLIQVAVESLTRIRAVSFLHHQASEVGPACHVAAQCLNLFQPNVDAEALQPGGKTPVPVAARSLDPLYPGQEFRGGSAVQE